MENIYDVIVIGCGPAGLGAALYTSRSELKTLVLEKRVYGGLITTTNKIDNYPGIEDCTGIELTTNMKHQCEKFGCEFSLNNVRKIEKKDDLFLIYTDKHIYKSKTTVYAAGTSLKKLNIKGEVKYTGMGVSYCATCDAAFFKDLEVCVIGGGDTALKESLYLSNFASKVTLIHRRDKLRGGKNWERKANKNNKINFIYSSEVTEIIGDNYNVNGIIIKNLKNNQIYKYSTNGVFIFIGNNPNNELVKQFVDFSNTGYILTNNDMSCKTQGLFIAGDVRDKDLRQVITATSDGVIAGNSVINFLENNI